jgi:PAP2 superfamily
LALQADRYTEGLKSPVAARAYAYIGVAAYLAAQSAGQPDLRLYLEHILPDSIVPKPEKGEFHMEAVLAVCYNQMFESLFLGAPRNIEQARKALLEQQLAKFAQEKDTRTLDASVALGKQVALAVLAWEKTDSIGHHAQMRNYDPNYQLPPGQSCWEPCRDFPTPSLLPHWGRVRTFAIETSAFLASPPVTFSEQPGSALHIQALELVVMNAPLSPENLQTAEFWSDDHPSLTFSSAGRWISITNQVIQKEQPQLSKTLETYLLVGIALSDALVSCWDSKYTYNLLRPETYVRRTMQPNWRPVMHTPPHPSYPSGHAQLASAAALALETLYGKEYAFTDRSHAGRTEFSSTPRNYKSFKQMADESAYSRIVLGVHFRMDCDEGARLGQLIGEAVFNKLSR